MEDIEIYILSNCEYSDLWLNNLTLLDKYWPNHPKVTLVSDDYGKYPINGYDDCLKLYQGTFSDRLIQIVNNATSKYLLWILDDIWLKKPINLKKMENIFELMKENDIDYCRLSKKIKIAHGKKDKNMMNGVKINFLEPAQVGEEPSIWKVESLKKVLHPGENVWVTEAKLSKRCKQYNQVCFAFYDSDIFPQIHVCRSAKYIYDGYKFIKMNDLFLSDRQVHSRVNSIKSKLYYSIRYLTPLSLRNFIKKIGHKRGKKYFSDFENE